MSDPAEQAGEIVAEVVASAIETANEIADDRADVAAAILDGAMETERAREVRDIGEDLNTCLEAQAAMGQTLETLALQVAEMSGVLSTLQASPPSIVLPSPDESVGDPLPTVEVIEPEAVEIQTPAPDPEPPAKPRGKKRLWI